MRDDVSVDTDRVEKGKREREGQDPREYGRDLRQMRVDGYG